METREILSEEGALLATITLPEGTSEEEWLRKSEAIKESASLEVQKNELLDKFDMDTKKFILSRYPIEKQMSLQLIRGDARADGLTNRFSYVSQVVDWVQSVLVFHFSKNAEIAAAETVEQLNGIELNLNQFVVNDPMISIETALSIID